MQGKAINKKLKAGISMSLIAQTISRLTDTSLMSVKLFCALLFLISSTSVYANNNPSVLRVAVASNFTPVLEQLLPAFTSTTNIRVDIISGSTGALYQQIQHGAPFDIYLAADNIRPQRLIAQNLAENLHTYAIGELALWSKHFSVNSLDALNAQVTRLAIANPKIAPYGKAAQQVLNHLDLWTVLKPKLIIGININQTFQQTYSGATSLGIIAKSQLMLNNLQGFTIPKHYYTPIEQQLVIVSSSNKKPQAEKFIQFLLSTKVQTQLATLGYLPQIKANDG